MEKYSGYSEESLKEPVEEIKSFALEIFLGLIDTFSKTDEGMGPVDS